MSKKEDFVQGALDAIGHVYLDDAIGHVYLDHLPTMLEKNYEKTGAVDWYMAGQIMTGKLLNEIKSKPLSTYTNNDDMR